MMKLHHTIPLCLALGLLLAGCDNKTDTNAAATAPSVRVTLVEMIPQEIDIQRELTGRTVAYRWAEVRPEVGGILKERCFTEGSKVLEGEVLYRIEKDTYLAELNRCKANLASAEADLTVTSLREKRTASMLKTRSVSQQDYDDVKAALLEAKATVMANKAAVESAEINYRRTEVKAPISGHIGISNYTAGALLTASQATPLTTIYQTNPMYVELSQSSDDLYSLRRQLGDNADIKAVDPTNIRTILTMHDGSVYGREGHLNFTGVDVDTTTNTITLRAEFENPDDELLPGLFVRATVIIGKDPAAILVPQKCVLRDLRGNSYVYIDNNGVAERRDITCSQNMGNFWYVTEGLKAGDKIVLHGLHNVRSGMQLVVLSDAEAAAANQTQAQ